MCAERCVAHNGDKRFINNISEKYIKSIKTLKGFAHISTHAFCWLRCHVRCRYLGKLFVSDDEIRSRKTLSWMRHCVAACSPLNILLGSSVKTFIFMLRKKLPRNTIGSGTNSDARRIPADADTQQNVSFPFSLRIFPLSSRKIYPHECLPVPLMSFIFALLTRKATARTVGRVYCRWWRKAKISF